MEYAYSIGIDMHKRYSLVSVKDTRSGERCRVRVAHEPAAIQRAVAPYRGQAAAAVEATGNWYWLVNELEAAGIEAHLAHPVATKPLINRRHKTDRIDADGISDLLAEDLLPESWIATQPVRDGRELLRARMALVALQTQTKNRIHALVARYSPSCPPMSDLFGASGSAWLARVRVPAHAQFVLGQLRTLLDRLQPLIEACTMRIHAVVQATPETQLLDTLPGVGPLLAMVIWYELGTVTRFPTHEHFCSYSGLAPVIHASGGKIRFGQTPKASNRYLRWAFVEAANIIAMRPSTAPAYQRFATLRHTRGHGTAIVALARHLAVAAFHMLRKGEPYREALWAVKGQRMQHDPAVHGSVRLRTR